MKNCELKAPATILVMNDGSFFYAAPYYEFDNGFTLRGIVGDLTVQKKGDDLLDCQHRNGLNEKVRVTEIKRVEAPGVTVGEGEAKKQVFMERIIVQVSGPRRWIVPDKAFSDFDPNKDVHDRIEIRRLVIKNEGESRSWKAVVPVSEAKVFCGEVTRTNLSVGDYPSLDESRRTQVRLPWTEGKKQARVLMVWLEDGLYAVQMPNLASEQAKFFIGSLAQFDDKDKPGRAYLAHGLKVECVVFDTAKREKTYCLMRGENEGAGVWLDDNCVEILADAEDKRSKCDRIRFKLVIVDEESSYPDPNSATYYTRRRLGKRKPTGTTRTERKAPVIPKPSSDTTTPSDSKESTEQGPVAEENSEVQGKSQGTEENPEGAQVVDRSESADGESQSVEEAAEETEETPANAS